MNGIFLFPIGWQILKQISKWCAKTAPQANVDSSYHAFGRLAHDDDDGDDDDMSMSCLNVTSLIMSLLLAIGGLGYAVVLYFQKVM